MPAGRHATLLIATCAVLIAIGLAGGPPPAATMATQPTTGDAALYRAIDRRVRAGNPYHHAAIAEQRIRDFPVRPFVAVRMPTRSWLFGALGDGGAMVLLCLLSTATVFAAAHRLRAAMRSRWLWMASVTIVAASVASLANPVTALWAELWAGLFVALSLACRGPHYGGSVVLGVTAVAFRELALPYLFAMAIAALIEQRRREALAWGGAIMVSTALIAGHAAAVYALVHPGDPVSQGWLRGGGWRFDLAIAQASTLLIGWPWWAAAIVVPLALLGWAATPGAFARRVTLALAGWLLPFLILGRPENAYWGLLPAPLWLAGVPLALPPLRAAARRVAQAASASG